MLEDSYGIHADRAHHNSAPSHRKDPRYCGRTCVEDADRSKLIPVVSIFILEGNLIFDGTNPTTPRAPKREGFL